MYILGIKESIKALILVEAMRSNAPNSSVTGTVSFGLKFA